MSRYAKEFTDKINKIIKVLDDAGFQFYSHDSTYFYCQVKGWYLDHHKLIIKIDSTDIIRDAHIELFNCGKRKGKQEFRKELFSMLSEDEEEEF